MIVYKITCSVTGKIYIGITRRSPIARLREHLANSKKLKKDGRHLYNAMRKYPDECWSTEVLAVASSREKLIALEIALIAEHHATNRSVGYNSTLGGDGVSGLVWTAEMRKQAAKRQTGTKLSPATIEKLKKLHRDPEYAAKATAALRKYRHGAEHYQRVADQLRGTTHSDEAKAKISAALKGKKKSAQHIANNAAARIGYKKTAEQKERSAKFHRGRTRSAETRRKISAALRGNTNGHPRKDTTCLTS